jgi:hypothetical protein
MSLTIYFLLPNRSYAGDGTRSTLGLSVENHFAFAVYMYGEYPPFNEYNVGNIEWVRDMEGDVFNLGGDPPDVEDLELTPITIEELGERMRDADFIIPYALPKASSPPPDTCG